MMTFDNGIDYFTSDINEPVRTDVYCLACELLIRGKKVKGARSWAGAMSDSKSWYWAYHCPANSNEAHEHLKELYKEAYHLASDKLRAIVLDELEEKRNAFFKGTYNLDPWGYSCQRSRLP